MARPSTERRWRGLDDGGRGPRTTLVALVLASLTLVVLDHNGGDDSVLEPVREVAGTAFGPLEKVTDAAVRPFTAVGDHFRSRAALQDDNDALRKENATLRQQVATADHDAARLAEYDALTRAAADLGRTLVPARVIGYGAAQSFGSTVTIDAGSEAGIRPDMTVLNADGLVGRVLRATRRNATVLLIVDPESVVGGRLGRSKEVGFLKGRGVLGSEGRLDLELLDPKHVPSQGDSVVSWGSDGAGPYVAGVPVGKVTEVYSSVREQSQRAVIDPYVDFSTLDVVGVVVEAGTQSDRAKVRADGGIG
ncbi:rod shape-determining protein MreC [Nocardioides yefusunii]|uniref:Cell shape-determining protein MreC n=1 Tax=Nocardioides yefusunii TaxID=2500546 RepID=A0ABW1QW70_9ACTN|nr:rod shape-determining protein MreC [Nocardioides yefusunii]